jgi:hypothetical protein
LLLLTTFLGICDRSRKTTKKKKNEKRAVGGLGGSVMGGCQFLKKTRTTEKQKTKNKNKKSASKDSHSMFE